MTTRIMVGDVRERLAELAAGSVQCCVTSPPYYGLRDYGTGSWEGGNAACPHVGEPHRTMVGLYSPSERPTDHAAPMRNICTKCGAQRVDKQRGLEQTVDDYVAALVEDFRAVRRVLRDDGTLWLNLGDSYSGAGGAPNADAVARYEEKTGLRLKNPGRSREATPHKEPSLRQKQLLGMPWRVALALQADGWYLRSDIIWHKPNVMPESVRDRPTKSHEYLFLFAKQARYYYDAEAIKEPFQSEPTAKRPRGTEPSQARALGQPQQAGVYGVGGRNARDVWSINTQPYKEAHFATFPQALAERCVKAGTSERGGCSACGAPWQRVIEKGDLIASGPNKLVEKPRSSHREISATPLDQRAMDGYGDLPRRERTTIGWQPACSCAAGDPVPCVVLDPFGGAGTVMLVCERLRRDSVYIDLSVDYADMAVRRLREAQRAR